MSECFLKNYFPQIVNTFADTDLYSNVFASQGSGYNLFYVNNSALDDTANNPKKRLAFLSFGIYYKTSCNEEVRDTFLLGCLLPNPEAIDAKQEADITFVDAESNDKIHIRFTYSFYAERISAGNYDYGVKVTLHAFENLTTGEDSKNSFYMRWYYNDGCSLANYYIQDAYE